MRPSWFRKVVLETVMVQVRKHIEVMRFRRKRCTKPA
jgi:hypothetical protein